MTEPEEEREKTPKTDATLHQAPTANPTRTRVRDADQKARNAVQQRERKERRQG